MDNKTETVSSHFNRLDGCQILRVLAFLGIFISHVGIGPFGALGAWGVSVFIIMSGFLMVYNHLGRGYSPSGFQCFIAHIRKLYPLHILMMVPCVALAIYGLFRQHGKLDSLAINVILNLSLLQAWIPKSEYYFSLNSVAWFLSVSSFLYFIFPNIEHRLESLTSAKTAWIHIILVLIGMIIFSLLSNIFGSQIASEWFSIHWITYVCPLYRIGDFIIGCNLGFLFLHRKEKACSQSIYSVCELLLFIIISIECYLFSSSSFLGTESFKYTLLFLPCNALLIWLFAEEKGIISKFLSTPRMRDFGSLCSYCFLIHLVMIRLFGIVFNKAFPDSNNASIVGIIAFAATVSCSVIYRKLHQSTRRKTA